MNLQLQGDAGGADIVALGEAMVEFNQVGDAGDRLYLQGLGGDTSNFAIAAARQGARVAYMSALGDDQWGQLMREQWRQDGVDHRAVLTNPQAHTGVYFVTHDAHGHHFSFMRQGSAASRMVPADLDVGLIQGAKVLHVSGVSLAISGTAGESVWAAIEIAREAGVRVCFDTNLRLSLWTLDQARVALARAMQSCDICLPSYDDVTAITGLSEPDALLDYCLRQGARIVALKLGARGAVIATPSERHRIAPFPCNPVDATGAGDAFGGAFVARLLAGDTPLLAGNYAAATAALSTEGFGAVAPVPDCHSVRQEMTRRG